MLDHILDHFDTADRYAANADRLAGLKSHSKRLRNLARRCREAAERERAEAAAHTNSFGIDPLVLRQEQATWRRLCQYSLDHAEALTLADLRWLRATARHGRVGSRNARRATELLWLAEVMLDAGLEDDPPSPAADASEAGHCRADGAQDEVDAPP